MSIDARFILGAVAIGIGATFLTDLWNLFLKGAFNVASLNYCLLGRWIRHMPAGTFRHVSINADAVACARLRRCHDRISVLHHATVARTRRRCLENTQAFSGQAQKPRDTHSVRTRTVFERRRCQLPTGAAHLGKL